MSSGQRSLFSDLTRMVLPYWKSKEWVSAWILMAITLGTFTYAPVLNGIMSQAPGKIINASIAAHQSTHARSLHAANLLSHWAMVLMLWLALQTTGSYFGQLLMIRWRKWLTFRFMKPYMENRKYLKLEHLPGMDNPDQRIQENINFLTQEAVNVPIVFLRSISYSCVYGRILWDLRPVLFTDTVIYAVVINILVFGLFGRFLSNLNFLQSRKEGNLRYNLIRVRDNAEGIAFYKGEGAEETEFNRYLQAALDNQMRIIRWQDLFLAPFNLAVKYVPYVFAVLLLAPVILSGKEGVGNLLTGMNSILSFCGAINLMVAWLGNITALTAAAQRLSQLWDAVNDVQASPDTPHIDFEIGDPVSVEKLTLFTPDYKRTLFENLKFTLEKGKRLLVVGPSGCGKSSLLRALAGIWDSGKGMIIQSQTQDSMFLPQKAYMIEGTLRDQVVYPGSVESHSDSAIATILESVKLGHILKREGGLDAREDFSMVLSPGEQQRIAFARLLAAAPKVAFLDEATSAVDLQTEQQLYQAALAKGITLLSVGHRPLLCAYHDQVLEFNSDNTWRIIPSSEYKPEW